MRLTIDRTQVGCWVGGDDQVSDNCQRMEGHTRVHGSRVSNMSLRRLTQVARRSKSRWVDMEHRHVSRTNCCSD